MGISTYYIIRTAVPTYKCEHERKNYRYEYLKVPMYILKYRLFVGTTSLLAEGFRIDNEILE